MEHVFLKWGMCSELLTDLGQEFEAELFEELLCQFGIAHLKSSGYRPQTNGACEVWHRTLNSMLAKVIKDNQRDWPEWVSYVVFCYNATVHSATGFPPFLVFTGRQPLWNVDLLLSQAENETKASIPDFTAKVVDRLERVSKLVRENLKVAADSASSHYNRRAMPIKMFTPGDNMRVFYPRRIAVQSAKWQSFYKTEGTVIKKINNLVYLIGSKAWKSPKDFPCG